MSEAISLENLRINCDKNIELKNYEKAIAYLSVLSGINYHSCQSFYDDHIESSINLIVNQLGNRNRYEFNKNSVLYYDGFGNDLRGLTIEYVLGLCKLGYKVIYITDKRFKDKQPMLHSVIDPYSIECIYFTKKSHLSMVKFISKVFLKYKPEFAFSYSWPHDVACAIVFQSFMESCTIYKINLTDDYYWAGVNCFHYLLEFRNWGASLSIKYRNIDSQKEILLPYYPFLIKNVKFEGLPFDLSKKFLFSGGSLWKTFDTNMTYYKMIDLILKCNKDIVFFYVGNGDCSGINKLKVKYPGRVFYQNERSDFTEIMSRCFLYLDTFPESGGLMIQYAIAMGKVPLIIKKDRAEDGEILMNQENIGVEFDTAEDISSEISKCINDEKYLIEKESKIRHAIISEDEFNFQLNKAIKKKKTDYCMKEEEININLLQRKIIDRFDLLESVSNLIACRQNKALVFDFPILYVTSLLKIIYSKIKRKKFEVKR